MNDDNEMVLWGTLRGWSKKLGISEDVLQVRFKNLPTQASRAKGPNDPTAPITQFYAEPDVMESCADLLRPTTVDSENLVAKDIRKEINEEKEGP